jgi:hypothetical protein
MNHRNYNLVFVIKRAVLNIGMPLFIVLKVFIEHV